MSATVSMTEAQVREDERKRVAALLRENAQTIGEFTGDATRAVELVAHLLRDHMRLSPALIELSREIRSR